MCIPQKCKTENNELVNVEENGWDPISLDEVVLITRGPRDLIPPIITDKAKKEGIDIPESDKDVVYLFTKRSEHPYLICGGFLFCSKWVSSNIVADRKFSFSEIPGNTSITIGEGDRSVTLDTVIALYTQLLDNGAELHLFDETGTKHIINFNVKHNKHPYQLPLDEFFINYFVANFVNYIISGRMAYDSGNEIANFVNYRISGRMAYDPGNEIITVVMKDERDRHLLTLRPEYFKYKDGKLYLEEKEMFEVLLSPEKAVGIFKNT
ncbi:Hypothetical protein HVR_LOCUS333 [uncultured virus]|nr:Hypothetical protein HVR_LOCUS333 [uncultured virus]